MGGVRLWWGYPHVRKSASAETDIDNPIGYLGQ